MYLKQLEIKGFKSFAQKASLEFNSGITAIVGPNGSGKSNIADAFRWVLGEQSLKLLRAKEGQDLIFGGGSSRTRTGLAEATLSFDNSTGWLPIEFSEVSIGRRLYRSGESEYFINGSQVRRRDIVELLGKAGIGSNPYTIIGQGLVDLALSMHPEERRRIFEEAAGLTLYKAKRDHALDKLAETMDNLRRVKDILQEISPRLASLARLAERAEKQKTLASELESLLLSWYGYQWHTTRAALQEAETREANHQAELERRRKELQDFHRAEEEAWARESSLRRDLAEWEGERNPLREQHQEVARQLAVLEERLRLIADKRLELQKDFADLQENQLEVEQREAEARTRLQVLQGEVEQASFPLVVEIQENPEEALARAREEAFQWATQAATLRNRQAQFRERKKRLEVELAAETEALAGLEGRRSQIQEQISQFALRVSFLQEELTLLRKNGEENQAAQGEAFRRREGLQNRLLEIDKSLARVEAQKALLSRIEDTLATWQGEIPGILGSLPQIIQFPAELSRAIEAALGPFWKGIVVESWDTVKEILVRRKPIPITLIPLDGINPTPAPELPQSEGILGLASQLVYCEPRYRPVVDALLGSTVIVHDLDIAQRLNPAQLQMVTLAGELITSQGIVQIGVYSQDGEQKFIQELASLQSQKQEPEEALYSLQREEAAGLDAERKRQEEERRVQEALQAMDNQHSRYLLEGERVTQEIGWRENILEQKRRENSSLAQEETGLIQTLAQATQREEAALSLLENLQRQLARGAKGGEEATSREVLRERMDRAQSLAQELEAGRKKLLSQIQEKEGRGQELSQQESSAREQMESLRNRSGELTSSLESIQEKVNSAQEELSRLWEARRESEGEETRGRQILYELEAQHGLAQVEIEKWRERLTALKTQIEMDLESVSVASPPATQFPLDIEQRLDRLPMVHEVPPETERRVKSLKRSLHQMGGVDMAILGEYQELKERHDFLSTQSQDLEQAEKDLRRMINQLNRLIEERFIASFQRVSEEFEIAFVSLFGGGRGRLLLTDPQNAAETGVEIIAQPPGKRRQSLATLSGGERALTGVALVFALLRAGGSPFCFLDEVDATLDETNIRRFREALQGLADKTQVVIITHNRATVEAAQTIYGITIEDSTSRVLSLRLEEVPA